MSEMLNRPGEQADAEADVESFRKELGPFVVAAETTRMAMVFTDAKTPDNRVVFANDSFLALTGFKREDVLGQRFESLLAHQAGAAALADVADVFSGTSHHDPELQIRRKDGTQFWASTFISPVPDENGAVVQHFASFIDLTRHKNAGAQIAFQAGLLDCVVQAVVSTDVDEKVVYWNRFAETLYGWRRDEALGRHIGEMIYGNGPVAEAGASDARREGGGEFTAKRRDGSTFLASLAASPVYDDSGVRTGIVGISSDITARKQAEAELRASEERYRALVTATSSILMRAAADGAITSVQGFEHYPGPQDDLLGAGWLDLVHPNDREVLIAEWGAVVGSGHYGEFEYRFRLRTDAFRWVRVGLVPLRNADGAVREWVGTLNDIHDRKEAEARLILRDRSLAAIKQGVVITDARMPDHPIIYSNPAFERLTGYSGAEVLGRNCRFLQGPETDRDGVARVKAALEAGRSVQETLVNYRKDGTPFENELTVSPVHASDGGLTHFVGTQSDVTERQRLEAQLRHSHKMEAVGQLTGGIAHDFNNLLTVILGNAEILVEDEVDPAQTRSLSAMILSSAERGAELNHQLLTFGRRQVLKPVPLDLGKVVQGMVPLLRRTIGEHIELGTEISQSTLTALTDRASLESAILNLVVNARDAMPQGGRLTIQTGQRKARSGEGVLPVGKDVTCVTVSDTGTGIPPELMSRVFEPFFTTKEVGKGTGLGLAMVYGFANQSGGHVFVRSKPGTGTSVTILLPGVTGDGAEAGDDTMPLPLPRGGERVLVVEDEPLVLQFVSSQLLGLGYEVSAVTNGIDAVAALKVGPRFDVLMTDLVLPHGMSGVELARIAKGIAPDLKVLFTSGYSEEVFRQHGHFGGETPLLRKPYKRRDLAEMLRLSLSRP